MEKDVNNFEQFAENWNHPSMEVYDEKYGALIKVPGTEKTLNLKSLFDLIKKDYPFKEDKIGDIARDIDNTIRFVTDNITADTNKDDLKAAFFTLYRLRDIFEKMEIGN